MLRTSVMATHTEAHVDRALAAFEEIASDGVVDAGRGALMSVLQGDFQRDLQGDLQGEASAASPVA
jgi:hypothetical protein